MPKRFAPSLALTHRLDSSWSQHLRCFPPAWQALFWEHSCAFLSCYVAIMGVTQVRTAIAASPPKSERTSSDNIAPPVASFLGDLVTLSLLGGISFVLIDYVNTVLPLIIAILLTCSAAACAVVVRGNSVVKDLIWQGWTPLFGAMVISSGTGVVLDIFASRYPGFPLLAVVISGEFSLRVSRYPRRLNSLQVYREAWGLYLSRVFRLRCTLLHPTSLISVTLVHHHESS